MRYYIIKLARLKTKRSYFYMLKYLILLLTFSQIIFAQNSLIVGKNYFGNKINEQQICDMVAFSSKPDVSRAIENIVRRSGLKQNFYVMECPNTDNCFAATRNGERLIVYDPSFMRKIDNVAKTDWAALSILAHEIGHHLQGHTIKAGGSEHEKELEADEFSGFVMYQMGAKLKEAQLAIYSLTTDYATSTHPARSLRLKAIETGYMNAKELYPDIHKRKLDEPIVVEKTIERPADQPKDALVFDEIVVERKTIESKKTGCITGNCLDGYGIAINSKSNEKYEGLWKLGKRNGSGKEFSKDGKLKYEGEFLNGYYHGKGTLFFKYGEKYVGQFYKGKMHGQNSNYYFRNGDKLTVNYENGKKQGRARIQYYGGVEGVKFFKDDLEIR